MIKITNKQYEEVNAHGQPAEATVAVSSTVTISSVSWSAPDQAVASIGVSMDAGDAGEMAVRRFGKTLKKLADT
jgi:hypothetical protein